MIKESIMTRDHSNGIFNENEVPLPETEEEELYRENILDHYKNPHNRGVLSSFNYAHQEVNPLCGDQLTVYLQVEHNRIAAASFEGSGCAISQAAASLFTDLIKNKRLAEIQHYGPWTIFDLLGVRISYTRSKCALLCLKTVQTMVKEKDPSADRNDKNA